MIIEIVAVVFKVFTTSDDYKSESIIKFYVEIIFHVKLFHLWLISDEISSMAVLTLKQSIEAVVLKRQGQTKLRMSHASRCLDSL